MKRTSTTTALNRNTSHTALKKNNSHGQLSRLGASKHSAKHAKTDRLELTRPSHPDKARNRGHTPPAVPAHPTVHFDIGDEDEEEEVMDGVDDGWTEESASQSPNTTRDNTRNNTRSNSMIVEPNREPSPSPNPDPPDPAAATAPTFASRKSESPPLSPHTKSLAPVTSATFNGIPVQLQHSRPPDADAIATRLLERYPAHHAPPKVSSVSAIAAADSVTTSSYARSNAETPLQGNTLTETPGRDLVSRFLTTEGSHDSKDGTPDLRSPAYLANSKWRQEYGSEDSDSEDEGSQNAPMSSNDTTPVLNKSRDSGPVSPTSTHSAHSSRPASGQTTPSHPSRFQQKLWLQRNLSNIEDRAHQNLPAVLPNNGALDPRMLARTNGLYGTFGSGGGGTGRVDPRLLQQFRNIDTEWKAVRRFRNVVGESIARMGLDGARAGPIRSRAPSRASSVRSAKSKASAVVANGHAKTPPPPPVKQAEAEQQAQAQKQTDGPGVEAGEPSPAKSLTKRNRVSFNIRAPDGDSEDESEEEPAGDETAEDICRRLWEGVEVG
ncbi:hypothetical protein LTR66_004557 [Elasticomyces elasticus]|nr:hypothetical protein LTR66_004557 [Elasticomyces elasticus]